MSTTYIAMDFETANPKRVSACSVGGCVIEGSEITDSFSTLIKPPTEFGEFAPMNMRIHGITPDKVTEAPTFEELFPKFKARVDGHTVISYSKFDLSVINSLLDYYGYDTDFKYLDVCALAKEAIPGLANYKLPTVAKHLGLGEFKHHDAVEDAIMCAKIFISLMQGNAKNADDGHHVQHKESFADAFSGFASSIVEDGVVDYKEAVELMWFLEVLPPLDVVNRLRQSVSDFIADGVMSEEESDILILQLGMAAQQFSGKPYVTCPVCAGPLLANMECQCPWCSACEVLGRALSDDAESHMDAIAESINKEV